MAKQTSTSGYKRIRLGSGRTRDQHRIIMESHLGRMLNRNEVVHHINGDKSDNRIENLVVMSLAEHGRIHMPMELRDERSERYRGERAPAAKLKEHTVIFSRVLKSFGLSSDEIAKLFGVTRHAINRAVSGKNWKHIKCCSSTVCF